MNDWPLWEVFVRSKGGMAHRHVGSVHAPDAEIALRHARDTYTRRMEGVSLWVVPSASITASDPGRGRGDVRSGRRQGLPPPDLLRHPGRHEAHLMASLPPIEILPGTGRGTMRSVVEGLRRTLRRPLHHSLTRAVRRSPYRGRMRRALFDYLLRLGDDSLILGQRLGEWCGHAPSVEVDLSLANIGARPDRPGDPFPQSRRRGGREGPRRRRARLPPRRARFPQLPAGRAAQWRLRPDDGAAIPVLDLAEAAVRPSRRARTTS